jgi:phospholipase C
MRVAGLSRRRFLATSALAAGATVVGIGSAPAAAAAPRRSAARSAARSTYGDLRDIKHVIVVMQENRSFDHYFGSLRGGRGFGDRSTIMLPGGSSVFQQPTSAPGQAATGSQYPWHISDEAVSAYPTANQPPSSSVGGQGSIGTPHSWASQHDAWQGGLMNGWVAAKGSLVTLGYLNRTDIPFHYALADAYTIGDAYHSSVLSATGPNRTFLWSGTINASGQHGHVTPYDGGDEMGRRLRWKTYAETLEDAGVSWRVYQCIDHFSDNGLEYFGNFAVYDTVQDGTPQPGLPLYEQGVATVPEPLTGVSANADNLIAAIAYDISSGVLPQVSWVVANQVFSEHPDGAPDNGAYLVEGILNALNADPDVLNSTLVIINYDENDGGFDHVPPPAAPVGTTDEWYEVEPGSISEPAGPVPIGLGFRVPLILVSPWTRGGWVTSEVSDHSSIIQLIEQWTAAIGTPAICHNVSAWRRLVCGDLTGAFDFTSPVYGLPALPSNVVLADPPNGAYIPSPSTNTMPVQEPGTKPARALPYQPNANLDAITVSSDGSVQADLSLSNNGPYAAKASHFAVYNNVAGAASYADYPTNAPSQYTVAPVRSNATTVVKATVAIGPGTVVGQYDVTVIGPNRFLRHFTGNAFASGITAQSQVAYYPRGLHGLAVLEINVFNHGSSAVTFTIRQSHYSSGTKRIKVPAHGHTSYTIDVLTTNLGWYDVTVTVSGDSAWSRRYVGHLEDGQHSVTGS